MSVPIFAAGVLFHSPSLRALIRAGALRSRLRATFGEETIQNTRRSAPLVLKDLPHLPLAEVDRSSHVYSENEGVRLTLDLYRRTGRPDSSDPSPLVLVVHGGSWNSGDSSQLPGMNRYLAQSGFAVAAINYRLAPRFHFPAPVEDIRSAIAFVEDRAVEWNVDPNSCVLLGRSSGGHLALTAAYTKPLSAIRGVIALYPPTDMHWSWEHPSPRRMMDSSRVIVDFLGGTPGEVPGRFDAASPIGLVRRHLPPTLLIHGSMDELVSPMQSRRLAAELHRVGAPHFHLELPWGKHGMDANLAGPSGQFTLYSIERFLAFTIRYRRGEDEIGIA